MEDISNRNTDKVTAVDTTTFPILPNILYDPQKIPEHTYARTNAMLQYSSQKWWVLIDDTWLPIRRVRPDHNPLWIECLLLDGGAVCVPWCTEFKVRLA